MTHRTKLEKVLELLINEESEQASELLHEIIVEKARDIYGQVVSESDDQDLNDEEDKDDKKDEEKVDEDFGGDMKDDYSADIEQDKSDIESDEIFNDAESAEAGEEGGEEAGEMGAEQSEADQLSNLEAQLADIKAMLASIPGVSQEGEGSEEFAGGDDMGAGPDMGSDEPNPFAAPKEAIGEATKFSNDVASTGQDKEGKFAGTGKNSQNSAVGNKNSLGIPSKKDQGGKPTQFSKSSGDGKEADKSAGKNADAPKGGNINAPQKDVKADVSGEGKFAGTGKNSKSGPVNTKSILTKRPG